MTISFEQLRTKFPLGIITGLTLATGIYISFFPYATISLPIPDIGGIFYRSLFIIELMNMVWISRYGWVKSFWLSVGYYGFHELIFSVGIFGLFAFTYLNPFWLARLLTGISFIIIAIPLKLFRINSYSIITGVLFFAYFAWLYSIWPIDYFVGEHFIPLSFIPQLQETLYNVFFPLWFYFLVRLK